MSLPIAIITADRGHWKKLSGIVSEYGFDAVRCETLAAAMKLIAHNYFVLAICEDQLPDGNFQELIAELKRYGCQTPIVVASRFDDWDSYLTAIGAGAFDFVALPPRAHELERVLAAALAEARSKRQTICAAAA